MAQKKNAAKKARPTLATRRTCHNGHRMVGDNVFSYRKGKKGKVGTWCAQCRANSRKRSNAKRVLGDPEASRAAKKAAREFLAVEFAGKRWTGKAPVILPDASTTNGKAKKAKAKAAIDEAFAKKAKAKKAKTKAKAKKPAKATVKAKATAKAKPAAKRPKRAARARAA